jgi:hypothetical protein
MASLIPFFSRLALTAAVWTNVLVAAPPYPQSQVIADLSLDWSTHRREAQGSDNFQLTWADDNQLYGAYGDGGGFHSTNDRGREALGFVRVEGNWDDYRGYNVWGGLNAENPAQFPGKSWGTISADGVLYSWVIPDNPDLSGYGQTYRYTGDRNIAWPRDHYRYIHLVRSRDRGASWETAPWRWWREDNLIIPTFLNYGRDNAGARDPFIYSYFIRPQSLDATQSDFGLNVHKPGALFLARVHKDHIFAGRDAYEWFTGLHDGKAAWGPLVAKQPVFENPEGTGWCVSAIYNPGLRRYLLATEHEKSHTSAMGLFDAPNPWGPWTTVKYWSVDDPFGRERPGSALSWNHNIFFFSFVPKWWSDDGREFTLVFTGGGKGKDNDSWNTVRGHFVLRQ